MPNPFIKIAKKPFFGRFMVPWRNPLDESETKKWNKVRLESPTGGKLSVWIQNPVSSPALGTIVMGHPMGKPAKAEFLKTGYAQFLIEKGFNVCIFDFNGFGESSMGNFTFHLDLLSVRDYARQQFPDLPMGYHGISFGTNWGIHAVAKEDNPFEYVILESGLTSLREFWVHYPSANRALKFLLAIFRSHNNYQNFEQRMRQARNVRQFLLIYSDTDIYTPVSMANRLEAASPAPTQLEIFPGAEHALTIKQDRERYLNLTLNFWNKMAVNR